MRIILSGATALLVAVGLAACGTARVESPSRTVQPGAPGEPSRTLATGNVSGRDSRRYSEVDVQFMQGMIVHHLQALEMTELAPDRTDREDVLLLARRIEIAQTDEIAMMRHWLQERGEALPGAGTARHGHGAANHHEGMPGMLTGQEMARLADAAGTDFDRLFLRFMIRHHEGALVMVEDLFSRAGGGQDTEIFQFASHVAGDQSIEIARMRRMLASGQ